MQDNDTITFTNGFDVSDYIGHLGFTINGRQFKLIYASSTNQYVFVSGDGDYTAGIFEAVQSESPVTELKFVYSPDKQIISGTTFEFYS